jgi:Farnesoic acid 0-methyl transferase
VLEARPLRDLATADSLSAIVKRSSYVICLGVALLAAAPACKPKAPVLEAPYIDTFDRAVLGPDWFDTSHEAKIKDGRLSLALAYNHPVWLKRRLPRNVQLDFDAISNNPSGDLKVELYGDGESFDPDRGRYDPTSYVFVLGGWNNSRSIIGRLGEHDETVKAFHDRQPNEQIVVPGRMYHFTITRKGGLLEWKVDGVPYLSWNDPDPLWGSGHEYFAVNAWEANVSFDNLTIRPLP